MIKNPQIPSKIFNLSPLKFTVTEFFKDLCDRTASKIKWNFIISEKIDKMGSRIWLCVIVALEAFYLPGMAPVSYCEQNDELNQCFSTIQIFVNRSGGGHVPLKFYLEFELSWILKKTGKCPSDSIDWQVQTRRFHSNITRSTFVKVTVFKL